MIQFCGRAINLTITCCLAATVLMSLGGCSSLNVVESWHKPAPLSRPYQKVMILGIFRDETLRQTFENLVVDEFSKQQIPAVASYTLVPDAAAISRDALVAAVRSSGCEAVLTTRPVEGGDKKVSQDGQGNVFGAGTKSSYGFNTASLQTNLYDTASQQLIWSATVKSFDAGKEARVSRELGRFFLEGLKRDGLL